MTRLTETVETSNSGSDITVDGDSTGNSDGTESSGNADDAGNAGKHSWDDADKYPQAGDRNNLIGWMGALFVSGGVLTMLGVKGKKNKKPEAE